MPAGDGVLVFDDEDGGGHARDATPMPLERAGSSRTRAAVVSYARRLRAPRHGRPRRRAAARSDQTHQPTFRGSAPCPPPRADARRRAPRDHRQEGQPPPPATAACPAVVYGHGVDPRTSRSTPTSSTSSAGTVGPNALVDLSVDGEKARPVLVHGVQIHPVNRRPLHVDLFLVRMTEELTVDVPLVAIGESPAVDAAAAARCSTRSRPSGSGRCPTTCRSRSSTRSSRSSTSTPRSTSATSSIPERRDAADRRRRDRRQGPGAARRGRGSAGRRRGRGRRGRGCRGRRRRRAAPAEGGSSDSSE